MIGAGAMKFQAIRDRPQRRDLLAGAVLCSLTCLMLSGWLTMCIMIIGHYASSLARCTSGAISLTILVLHAIMTAPNAVYLFQQLLQRVWCQTACASCGCHDDPSLASPTSTATPSPPSSALAQQLLPDGDDARECLTRERGGRAAIWLLRLLGLVHAAMVVGSCWVLHAVEARPSSPVPATDTCHHALAHHDVQLAIAISLTLSICTLCALLLCC